MAVPKHPLRHYPAGEAPLRFLDHAVSGMFDIIDCYLRKYDPDKYDRSHQPDRPYFYNERATLSLLAGGIWRTNAENLVMEEYRAPKQRMSGAYMGRGDIWFEAERCSSYGEAKQMPFSLRALNVTKALKLLDILESEAKSAVQNVKKELQNKSIHHAFGILFVIPHLRKIVRTDEHNYVESFETALQKALEVFVSTNKFAVLWGRYFRRDFLEEDKFYVWDQGSPITHPGLDVLICELR